MPREEREVIDVRDFIKDRIPHDPRLPPPRYIVAHEVEIRDVTIGFWRLVMIWIKIMLAAVPALIVCWFLFYLVAGALTAGFMASFLASVLSSAPM